MIFTIGDLIADQMRDKSRETATPEGLRAAAKLLEDKAKELEKPKLTLNQQVTLDYVKNVRKEGKSVRLVKFGDAFGETTYQVINSDGSKASWDSGTDKCKIVHTFSQFITGIGFVSFKVYYGEYNDLEVAVSYP